MKPFGKINLWQYSPKQIEEENLEKREIIAAKIMALLTEEGVSFLTARSALTKVVAYMSHRYKEYIDDSAASAVLGEFTNLPEPCCTNIEDP